MRREEEMVIPDFSLLIIMYFGREILIPEGG
jgi:hypothetical protein